MSKFLSLKFDPISQPAANDPVERQTWCSLRVKVGSRFASRLWDKTLEEERETLDVPAFPIAEWIVQNWWSLLNELCPWESVPRKPIIDEAWLSWIKRHCLRSADSALCPAEALPVWRWAKSSGRMACRSPRLNAEHAWRIH